MNVSTLFLFYGKPTPELLNVMQKCYYAVLKHLAAIILLVLYIFITVSKCNIYSCLTKHAH
jgi:hypothetical protein